MKLVMEKMVIDHFKGIDHMEVSFGTGVTHIQGRNGSGKTSIADAYTWVLLGKDAAGNAPGSDDFREKPLDENGEEVHMVETAVSLYCKLDGEPFILTRSQEENWVKTRGKSEQKFQGNVSKYFINNVPVKLGEFNSRIAEIADPDSLRFITLLGAFNAAPWQDRRKALIAMSGIDVDAELMKRAEYEILERECLNRGVNLDELKKIMKDALRELKKKIELVPARIDEATRALPQLDAFELHDAETALETMPAAIAEIDNQIAAASTNTDAAARAGRILSLQTELTSLQNAVRADLDRSMNELRSKMQMAKAHLHTLENTLEHIDNVMEDTTARLDEATKRRADLAEQYQDVYVNAHPPISIEDPAYTTCPTCGQLLPEDQREALIDKVCREYEESRQKQLAQITEAGKRTKAEMDKYQEQIEATMAKRAAAVEEAKQTNMEMNELQTAMNKQGLVPDYSTNPRIGEIEKAIELLKAEGGNDEPTTEIDNLKAKRAAMKAALDQASALIAKRDNGRETEKRIAELREHQRYLGDMVSETESVIMACENFAKDRCQLLTDTIDGMFPTVRWKLFNQQINGGLADCCMAMIPCNGVLVPYGADEMSHSANTAARLHADAEIVETISNHMGIRAPLFFDGAERVNVLPAFGGQLIALEVTNDDEIRVTAD